MPLNQPLWVKRFKEQQPVRDQITITGRQQPMVNAVIPQNRTGMVGNPVDSTYSTGAGRDGVVQENRSTGRDMVEFHEGEEVVSKPTVDKLGGNKNVRALIDRELVRQGMEKSKPTGGVPMGKGGQDLVGYYGGGKVKDRATRTMGYQGGGAVMGGGYSYVSAPRDPIQTTSNIANPPADTPSPEPGDTGVTPKGIDTQVTPTPDKPTPPPEAPPPIDQAAVGTMQQEMLHETRDVAMGKSKLMESLANQGFQNLDARQQTQLAQTAMQISADPNLTEGQKRSMMAQTMRDHGIAQSDLAGDLAIASMKEARQAQGQLFKMTQDIRRFEQNRFESERDYNERRRQWQENFDYRKSVDAINASIDAGDFEGAQEAWSNLGFEVDYTEAIDAQDQRKINASMVNISANVAAGMDMTNDVMLNDLESAWSAMHPDEPFNIAEGTDSGDWARKTIDQMKRNSDPIAADIYALEDDTLSAMVRPSDAGADWKMEDFEYKGLKGRKAAEAVMLDIKMEKGYTFDADGNMTVDWNNPIWAATGVTKPHTTTPATTGDGPQYEQYGFTEEEFDDAVAFGDALYKDNVAYVRTNDKIVPLTEYQDSPDFTNDPVFKGADGETLPPGSRVQIGEQDWKRNKRNKRTGVWQKAEPPTFDQFDPWSAGAQEIIDLGPNYDMDLYKSAVDARAQDIVDNVDISKLRKLDKNDPVYQKAVQLQEPYEGGGYYETTGNNQQNFTRMPPAVDEMIKIGGEIYVVTTGVQTNYKTGASKEYQYFRVKSLDGKKNFEVRPGGLDENRYGSGVLNASEGSEVKKVTYTSGSNPADIPRSYVQSPSGNRDISGRKNK